MVFYSRILFHQQASSEVERQRWITVLELAKSLSSEMLDSGKLDCRLIYFYLISMHDCEDLFKS